MAHHPDDMMAVYVDGHLIEMTRHASNVVLHHYIDESSSYADYCPPYAIVVESEYRRVDQDFDGIGYPGCNYEVFKTADGKWYWWPCSPGCLPDGEEKGPFNRKAEAIADAEDF